MSARVTHTAREDLWSRIRSGDPVALLGHATVDPPPGRALALLRVRCDLERGPLGTLAEARRLVESALGVTLLDQARGRVKVELRRRLLGDVPELPQGEVFIDACNRLASRSEQSVALVLEHAEHADEQSVALLRRALSVPGRLRLPLVVAFAGTTALGPAARLVETIERGGATSSARAPRAPPHPSLACRASRPR
jgi:hypothetical protein